MMSALKFLESAPGAIRIGRDDGRVLWRYVFEPDTPARESSRPFVHPLYSIDGDVLTNWRPNDHPWHHGLSFTLTAVNGINFWGGPSHRAEDSYQWRDDHGVQCHVDWLERSPERLVEKLEWRSAGADGEFVLGEERTMVTRLIDDGWSLDWKSRLQNSGDEDLVCHNYHSLGGLEGSHYSGLQFRGARGLLDEHGDETVRMVGASGESDIAALHGQKADWVEWHAQTDGSLRRVRLRFESPGQPIPWFLRRDNPLVAFPPHREGPWVIPAGGSRELSHQLSFTRM